MTKERGMQNKKRNWNGCKRQMSRNVKGTTTLSDDDKEIKIFLL
jgi:hypothetical protein